MDVTEFDPNVTVGDKTYQWSLLERDTGTIDLGHRYKDNSLITYTWAQINISEKQDVDDRWPRKTHSTTLTSISLVQARHGWRGSRYGKRRLCQGLFSN